MAPKSWETMAAYKTTEAVIEEYVARKGWLLSRAVKGGNVRIFNDPARVWPPLTTTPLGHKYHTLMQGKYPIDAAYKESLMEEEEEGEENMERGYFVYSDVETSDDEA